MLGGIHAARGDADEGARVRAEPDDAVDARSGMLASERGSAPPEATTVVAGGLGSGQGEHTMNQGGHVTGRDEGCAPLYSSASPCG